MKNILGIAKMLNRHGLTALFLAFIALLGLWNLPAAGQTGQEALSPEPSAQEDGSRGGGFLDAWTGWWTLWIPFIWKIFAEGMAL